MISHCQNIGRSVHLMNLDPAAEKFEYDPSIGLQFFFLFDLFKGLIQIGLH